jgi:hypothetical protein
MSMQEASMRVSRSQVKSLTLVTVFAVAVIPFGCKKSSEPESTGGTTLAEARAIAKDAYIYGFPLVDNYRIIYAYFVDQGNKEYKAPFNQIINVPRVYTPEDKAVQTPNSDTPYSFAGMDLRAEPVVLTLPAIPKNRYYSVQLVDAYTHNFAYLGSRTTGNGAGSFLIAGPDWKGETPKGIKKVLPSETQIVVAVYRTQLFNPADLDNVKRIQAGYKVQPLSVFLGQPAPPAAPKIDFPKPLSPAEQKTSLEFFDRLNFWLQFCPTVPSETEVMARFSKINVGAGRTFDPSKLSPGMRQAITDAMADAWKAFADLKAQNIDTGKVTAGDALGSREDLKNNYLYRMAGAVLGIYGNSKAEAMYPAYAVDASGQKVDASKHNYTLHFAPGQLPPVNAFWSITMYELPASLLVANPLNRYLINSPMLPNLKRDPDGGLTLYVQKDSPGKARESNWLPAPNGPFIMWMRLYWPKTEALDGTWKQPPLRRVN